MMSIQTELPQTDYPAPITGRRLITAKILADRLKTALAGRGVPQHGAGAELGRITGSAPQAAARWLTGKAMPNYANILRICYAYGIEPGWLLTGYGPMYVESGLQHIMQAWTAADAKGRNILESVASQMLKN